MNRFANIHRLIAKPEHWGWVEGLYLAGNDCGIAMRLLDGQGYEEESRKLWRSLSKGKLVIDIGAHTGIYSLDAWKAGAESVLSIEPYYLNFARLMMNLRHSGFKVEDCIMCAISDVNGEMNFSVTTANHYCSAGGQLDKAFSNAGVFRVKARRLDSLIKKESHSKISMVKVDVENHGARVLKGMTDILKHRPDLILECTEHGMTEILKPLGYKFFKIHEKDGLSPVEDLSPDNPFTFDSPNRYATCS
jgi:FkbM family methyltransferase